MQKKTGDWFCKLPFSDIGLHIVVAKYRFRIIGIHFVHVSLGYFGNVGRDEDIHLVPEFLQTQRRFRGNRLGNADSGNRRGRADFLVVSGDDHKGVFQRAAVINEYIRHITQLLSGRVVCFGRLVVLTAGNRDDLETFRLGV